MRDLNSMPGGGGEILDDEVRKRVSTKCNTQEWLDVMRAVHKVGLAFDRDDDVRHRRQDFAPRQTSCKESATCRTKPAVSRRLSRGHFSAKTPRSAEKSRKNRPELIT